MSPVTVPNRKLGIHTERTGSGGTSEVPAVTLQEPAKQQPHWIRTLRSVQAVFKAARAGWRSCRGTQHRRLPTKMKPAMRSQPLRGPPARASPAQVPGARRGEVGRRGEPNLCVHPRFCPSAVAIGARAGLVLASADRQCGRSEREQPGAGTVPWSSRHDGLNLLPFRRG